MRIILLLPRIFISCLVLGRVGGMIVHHHLRHLVRSTFLHSRETTESRSILSPYAWWILIQKYHLCTGRYLSSSSLSQYVDANDHLKENHLLQEIGQFDDGEECRWLIVGDGDLSYAAHSASRLLDSSQSHPTAINGSVKIVATVWEDETTHHNVYQRSLANVDTILSASPHHRVLFGIDATKLHTEATKSMLFMIDEVTKNESIIHSITKEHIDSKFHLIDFNFPHWKGKTNARRNRELIDEFLRSAVQILDPTKGRIRIALHQNQGGFPSQSSLSWKQSWLVPMIASEHNLLLCELEDPFVPTYAQTSHRGVDRPWKKDGILQRYIFLLSNDDNDGDRDKGTRPPIDPSLQMSCRHELRIVLPVQQKHEGGGSSTVHDTNKRQRTCSVLRDDIIDGTAVHALAKRFVPAGIHFEIPGMDLLSPYDDVLRNGELAVFLINYSGEYKAITRSMADKIRQDIEDAVQNEWGFKVAKSGRMVSKPYPRHLLPQLIDDYKRTQHGRGW